MALTENISEEEIVRYILAEMDNAEREAFDDMVMLNDNLFFAAADLENRMVDSYVAGHLSGADLVRFERSLDAFPGRRQKVANARSLHEFIEGERPALGVAAEERTATVSIWRRLGFSSPTPSFAYGMGALAVFLALSTIMLVVQNQRKGAEIARLQQAQPRQEELQIQLDAARQRESELQLAIDAERDTTGDLQQELDRERSHRADVERELSRMGGAKPPPPGPSIASAILLPLAGGRGGDGGTLGNIRIGAGTKRVLLRLNLPGDVTMEDRLSVRVNEKPIASDLKPRRAGDNKSITVTLPAQTLKKGRNDINALDAAGRTVSNYGINVLED